VVLRPLEAPTNGVSVKEANTEGFACINRSYTTCCGLRESVKFQLVAARAHVTTVGVEGGFDGGDDDDGRAHHGQDVRNGRDL
jgi:hypothetical protein